MADKDEQKHLADLERTNAELAQSLQRCRELLEQCESQLTAKGATPSEGSTATAR